MYCISNSYSLTSTVLLLILLINTAINVYSSPSPSPSRSFTHTHSMKSLLYSFKQSINIPALRGLVSLVKHPSLMVPHVHLTKLSDIDIHTLKKSGIKYVVFDKDNTLTYTYKDTLHPSLHSIMEAFKTEFTSDGIAILSNSVGSSDDIDYIDAAMTEKMIGVSVIRHKEKKPNCRDDVLDHFNTKFHRVILPNEICMIGDRVLTDIVFANQCSMTSVLVAPLSYVKDHPIASIIRLIERKLILPILSLFLRTAK